MGVLGGVHGYVGVAEQSVSVGPVVGEAGDANRWAHIDHHGSHLEGLFEQRQEIFRHQSGVSGVSEVGQHNGKLIAAETGGGVSGAHSLLQTLADLHQQLIPELMTQ